MGDLDPLTVILAIAGMTILYGAIKNRNPLDVIKLTLQGKDISGAAPLANATGGVNPFVQTVPGQASADPSEFHSDGTPRAYPNGSPRYVGDPLPSQLPQGDPRNVFSSIPAPGATGDPRAPKDAHRAVSYIQPLTSNGGGAFV